MSLNRADLRHFAYDHPVIGPALGFYGVATSITGTTITDPTVFGNTNYGTNHFAGKGLVILPNRDGTDHQKQAGQISGTVLSVDDASAYSATYPNEPWEFLKGGRGPEAITLTRLNNAAQNALRRIYFDIRWPVSQLWQDGDCNLPGTDNWTPSSVSTDITVSKSATAGDNRTGLKSLLVNYKTANQYVQHALGYNPQPGDELWMAALPIILTSGSVALKAWDDTHNAQIGQTITANGPGKLHMGNTFKAPSGCYAVNMRLGGDAGVQVAWDAFPSHDLDGLNWQPDDWLDANWKLYGIDVMSYGRQTAQVGVQTAMSGQPERWQPGIDYTTANMAEDASPNLIQVMKSAHRRLPACDLWYYGRRRESERAELADELQTTNADRDYLEAAFLSEVCQMLEARDKLGAGGTWQTLQRDFEQTVSAQRVARVQMTPQPRQVHRSTVM